MRNPGTRGLRGTWSGPEKPPGRRSNTRGLLLTRSGREKLWRRQSTTRGFPKKHGTVAKNLEDVDVIHVDVRETLSGREKPRGRRSSPRGLRET